MFWYDWQKFFHLAHCAIWVVKLPWFIFGQNTPWCRTTWTRRTVKCFFISSGFISFMFWFLIFWGMSAHCWSWYMINKCQCFHGSYCTLYSCLIRLIANKLNRNIKNINNDVLMPGLMSYLILSVQDLCMNSAIINHTYIPKLSPAILSSDCSVVIYGQFLFEKVDQTRFY